MEKIKYFDKNLFMNGKLAVVVETVEQLENIPEWLQANKITDVFLSVTNKQDLHLSILNNKPAPYFRYNFEHICTGSMLGVAREFGCTHFCYITDCLKLQIDCDEFEEFLKDFW